jgi:formate dehydrogenase major subunit
MDLSRRQFFKVAGIGLAGSSLGALGMAPTPAFAEQVRHFKLAHTMKPATPARTARSAAA